MLLRPGRWPMCSLLVTLGPELHGLRLVGGHHALSKIVSQLTVGLALRRVGPAAHVPMLAVVADLLAHERHAAALLAERDHAAHWTVVCAPNGEHAVALLVDVLAHVALRGHGLGGGLLHG